MNSNSHVWNNTQSANDHAEQLRIEPMTVEEKQLLVNKLAGVEPDFPDYIPNDERDILFPETACLAALQQLAASDESGQPLNALESLGRHLLRMKAVAEYVTPEPEPVPMTVTRIGAEVHVRCYADISEKQFLDGLLVSVESYEVESVKAKNIVYHGAVGELRELREMALDLELVLRVTHASRIEGHKYLEHAKSRTCSVANRFQPLPPVDRFLTNLRLL